MLFLGRCVPIPWILHRHCKGLGLTRLDTAWSGWYNSKKFQFIPFFPHFYNKKSRHLPASFIIVRRYHLKHLILLLLLMKRFESVSRQLRAVLRHQLFDVITVDIQDHLLPRDTMSSTTSVGYVSNTSKSLSGTQSDQSFFQDEVKILWVSCYQALSIRFKQCRILKSFFQK